MDIAAAKKRCEAAAKGPWRKLNQGRRDKPESWVVSGVYTAPQGKLIAVNPLHQGNDLSPREHQANAEFIAHARTDLPAALEALEAAAALMEEALGKLEAVEEMVGEQSRDGKCLRCGAPIEHHDEMSPACWVKRLDRILRGSKEGE